MNVLNKLIVQFVKLLPKPVVYIFAKKYVAGETLEHAMEVVKKLNEKGIMATMDVLGEAITTRGEAQETKKKCMEVLDAIHENNLNSNLSIKPTSVGLAIDEAFCQEQVEELLTKAREYKNFIRIDMEDSPFTGMTLKLYDELRKKYDNVGVVVQAYLKRTYDDVSSLNAQPANYRLCKGIYIEPEEIAYKDRQKVRDNYVATLERMFDDGAYVGIATHDEYLVNEAYRLIKEKNVPKDKYEFQMLYGVTENLRDKINADGHRIRIYVPFGKDWYAYSVRRLQENPQVAWYITKSLFTFQ